MAYLVLGVVIISKDDNGGRGQEKKKKNMYLKRSPCVALLLQVTFTFMHSIGLMWMQKFCKFAHLKPIFFYFIHSFLQNTYISLSILHIYLIKFSFFYNFFNYFLTHCLSLSLSLSHCLSLSQTQPPSSPTPIGEQTHSRPIEVVETQIPVASSL